MNALSEIKYGCESDFGTLREAVVGIVEDLTLPPFSNDLAHYNDELRNMLQQSGGNPVSIKQALPERYERATNQLDGIVNCFEKHGVKVHRPRPFSTEERQYLGNLQAGWNQLYAADPVFMLGNHFLEVNIRRAYRRKEVFPLRDVVLPLIADDMAMHHVAMPHANPWSPAGSGPGPYLEGGDLLMCGNKDIIVGLNDAMCSNQAGFDWLKRYMEPYGYRLHPMQVEGQLLHGLGVMALIREGLLLAYMDSLPGGLPDVVKDWEVIELSYEDTKNFATVGLSLDQKTYVIDEVNTRVIEELEKRNVTTIPLAAKDIGFFGGDIRCVTLPLARD
ncbi:MAG: amidinotransferase [Gammaproteobacteria bacterium]|nr:amidinotransferase [Gammaproteobacteria bacterium]